MSLDSAPGYQRRTRWPIVTLLAVLAIGGIVVWTQALKPTPEEASGCNQPGAVVQTSSATAGASQTSGPATRSTAATTAATTLGKFVEPQVLATIRPADPTGIPLRVFNASTVTGQAKTVTDELRAAGFSEIGQQDNDPLYPAADLRCYGEIRYGYAGQAEARTTLIIAPCAQLVLDGRLDNSVDLSLGKRYEVEPISKQVQAELATIRDAAAPPPVIEGQTLSVRSVPPIPPLPNRAGCPA